jgi:hypothetical protein
MPDDEKLTPADPRNVETALALALTNGKALARDQSAESMSPSSSPSGSSRI